MNDVNWDNAVIPAWPVDHPLPAEAADSTRVLDRRRLTAAVAPGFACPQQFDGALIAAPCIAFAWDFWPGFDLLGVGYEVPSFGTSQHF